MKKYILVLWVMCVATTATTVSAELSLDMDTIVVTAHRHERPADKVAGNVSVITREQIEASNAQSVPDLLQQVQGVYVYDTNTTKTSVVDIRGFGDTAGRNVLVLIDGRRMNVASSGSADLVQIPIGAIERIEVLRGGGSVLYGDNAVGGVVNIITRKGEDGMRGKITYFGGSYGASGEELQLTGREKKLSYYLYAKYYDKQNYRENSDELFKNINGRLDYDLSDQLSLGIQYGFHEDSYELPGGLNILPNGMGDIELVEYSRRGVAPNEAENVADTEDQYIKAYMTITPIPEDGYIGHFVIDGTWRDREVFDFVKSTFPGFDDFKTNREIETEGFVFKYIYDRSIADHEVDLVLGFDKYRHSNFVLGSGSNTDNLIISKDELGIFGQFELELVDDFYFVGGSRYHKATYSFDQRAGSPSFEQQKPDESVSSGGFKYEYGAGSNVFINYQQTFRFLTPNEWYSSFSGLNTDLEQQRGRQYEMGIKHNFKNQVAVSVTPYWMETEDEIFFDPTLSPPFGSNSNYDEIRRVGVELGTRVDVLSFLDNVDLFDKVDELEWFANYTFQNPEFTNGANDGKQVPHVPEHQANSGLRVRFLDHYKVSLTSRYVGSRYAINDTGNLLPKAKAYFVTDLRVSYSREHWEMFLAVNNLFDRKYNTYDATNSSRTVRDVYPAPEKNILGGVSLKF